MWTAGVTSTVPVLMDQESAMLVRIGHKGNIARSANLAALEVPHRSQGARNVPATNTGPQKWAIVTERRVCATVQTTLRENTAKSVHPGTMETLGLVGLVILNARAVSCLPTCLPLLWDLLAAHIVCGC